MAAFGQSSAAGLVAGAGDRHLINGGTWAPGTACPAAVLAGGGVRSDTRERLGRTDGEALAGWTLARLEGLKAVLPDLAAATA